MSNISSWLLKRQKRAHSSTSDDGDTSLVSEKQEKKLTNLTVDTENTTDMAVQKALDNMSRKFQEAIDSVNEKLTSLSTNADVEEIRGELRNLTDTFKEKIGKIEGRLFDIECRAEQLEDEVRQAKKNTEAEKETIRHLDFHVKQCETEQNDLQQYSRRWNLRVFRVPEQQNESADDCVKKVVQIFTDSVGVKTTQGDVEVAHRMGQRSGAQARPILVRFFDRRKKDDILCNRRKLKNKGIIIGEDLTHTNYQLLKRAMGHSATMSVWSANGKIFAKVKNGRVLKLSIHSNLDKTFKRAMNPGSMNIEDTGS